MKQIDFLVNDTLQRLELLANDTNSVLWARDPSYSKQLFVSANYQKIWQRSVLSLYQDPLIWGSYLIKDQQDRMPSLLRERNTPINPKHTENFCFLLPDGTSQ